MKPIELLLSLATSTQRCSAALLRGAPGASPILQRVTEAGPGRSGDLLGLVRDLLAEAGAVPADIDVIAFDAGPGAFTGLRVGCGVAQGLGFALARPVVPVTAFEALDPGPGAARLRLLAIDARMSEVYHAWAGPDEDPAGAGAAAGAVAGGLACPAPIRAPSVGGTAAAVALFEAAWREIARLDGALGAGQVLALGSGFASDPALARWAVERGCRVESDVWPDAGRVAHRGWALAHAGRAVPAHLAAPVYVRDKVALDSREQAEARAARAGGQQ